MKETILKWLPIAGGALIGWLVARPPEFLGPWRWPIALGIGALLFAGMIALSVLKNLPENLQFEEIPDGRLPGEFPAWIEEARPLGYEVVDGPFRAMISPPATMVILRHREYPVLLALFKTGTVPPQAAYDFITTFEGMRAGLTSSSHRHAGSLPAGPGALKQVLPGRSLTALHAEHGNAVAWLGLRCDPLGAHGVREMVRVSLARQRRDFLRRPLRNTVILLKRALTGANPHLARLDEQPAEQAQIARLRAGDFP